MTSSTSLMNQDVLECYFSEIRGLGLFYDHPNPVAVIQRIESSICLLYTSLLQPPTCTDKSANSLVTTNEVKAKKRIFKVGYILVYESSSTQNVSVWFLCLITVLRHTFYVYISYILDIIKIGNIVVSHVMYTR